MALKYGCFLHLVGPGVSHRSVTPALERVRARVLSRGPGGDASPTSKTACKETKTSFPIMTSFPSVYTTSPLLMEGAAFQKVAALSHETAPATRASGACPQAPESLSPSALLSPATRILAVSLGPVPARLPCPLLGPPQPAGAGLALPACQVLHEQQRDLGPAVAWPHSSSGIWGGVA